MMNSKVFELNKLLSELEGQGDYYQFYKHNGYAGRYHTITRCQAGIIYKIQKYTIYTIHINRAH